MRLMCIKRLAWYRVQSKGSVMVAVIAQLCSIMKGL